MPQRSNAFRFQPDALRVEPARCSHHAVVIPTITTIPAQVSALGKSPKTRKPQSAATGLPVFAFPKEREYFVELRLPAAAGAGHGAV